MGFDLTPSWSDFTSGLSYLRENPEAGLLFVPATYPLFALGAGVNELTGGDSPTYNAWAAAQDSSGTIYSPTTQALSGYQGDTPSSGEWNLPLLNPQTPRVVGDILHSVSEGVLGFDVRTLLPVALLAAAAAFGFGNAKGRPRV